MKVAAIILVAFLCGSALLIAGCPRAERLAEYRQEGGSGWADQETGEGSGGGSGVLTEVPGEVPVYPGATLLGSGREVAVSGTRIEGFIDGSTYHVDADYGEVAVWYRDELTGELEFAATLSGESRSGRGTIFLLLSGTGKGAAVTVAMADDFSGTTINIGVWEGTIREEGQ